MKSLLFTCSYIWPFNKSSFSQKKSVWIINILVISLHLDWVSTYIWSMLSFSYQLLLYLTVYLLSSATFYDPNVRCVPGWQISVGQSGRWRWWEASPRAALTIDVTYRHHEQENTWIMVHCICKANPNHFYYCYDCQATGIFHQRELPGPFLLWLGSVCRVYI